MPGAGDGDVGEPPFLQFVACLDRRLEVLLQIEQTLARARRLPVERRQLGGIPAELVRQRTERQPAVESFARGAGQFLVHEPRHDHEVPLETLRAVDGEQLHRTGLGILGSRRESVTPLRLPQPAEEAAEARRVVDHKIAGERVEERLHRGRSSRARLVCRDLDIEQQLLLNEGHEIEQVEAQPGTQPGERRTSVAQATQAHLAEIRESGVPLAGGGEEVERVDYGAALALGDRGPQPLSQLVAQRPLGDVPIAQPGGQAAEGMQVSHADPPARPGQQPHQLRSSGRVVHHRERAHQVGDLRLGHEPADAEQMERNPVLAQCVDEHTLGLACAEQHRRGRRLVAARHIEPGLQPQLCFQPQCHSPRLLRQGLLIDHIDGTVRRERCSVQPLDRHPRRPARRGGRTHGCGERLHQGVGDREDAMAIPPARGQCEIQHRTPTELPRETLEVGRARAAPAVDRLVGIAHRHHRMPGKEFGQQPGLHDARVLVLVEQHHPEAFAELVRHHRDGAHDLKRERHLVRVFDESTSQLRLGEALRRIEQDGQRTHRLGERDRIRVLAPAAGGQLCERGEAIGHRAHLCGIRDVFAQRAAERDHRPGHGVDVLAELRQPLIRCPHHDRTGQLPGGCLTQHRTVALAPQQDGIVAVDRVREGVVGGDNRWVELVVVSRQQARIVQLPDPFPDAAGELPRSLAGEGEAQYLASRDVSVREQPQHPVGHGLGLAAARARDDERRFEWRLDDGALLLGGTRLSDRIRNVVRTHRTLLSHC